MLLRNTIWSLLGEGLPMAAALISIPVLIHGAGMERFGALTFVWALLGMLAVLDLGLSRSLVQIVADRRGNGGKAPVVAVAGPALLLITGLGLVAGVATALGGDFIVDRFIQASGQVQDEARRAVLLAALIAPVALLSAGLRGVLEAHQQFRAVNIVRMIVGIANYLSPVAVLPFSDSLSAVLAAIVAGRFVGLIAFLWLAAQQVPDLLQPAHYRGESLRPLFSMSVWMMLNNLLGPVMTYADRFILAGLLPVAAVAYYATPLEIASRLLFIPTALSSVLFPMAAGSFRRDPAGISRMLAGAGMAVLGMFSLAVCAAAVLGEPALRWWLGEDFAANSAPILTAIMLGIMLNAVAYAPYSLILGIGRVDVTAKLQLLQLPPYLAVLWLSVDAFGLIGAAAAWGVRTGTDLLLLLWTLRRLAPPVRTTSVLVGAGALAAALPAAVGLWAGGPWGLATLLTACGGVAVFAGLRLRHLW
jgi:O-antigen/teichoic acid export membrane protein